MINNKKISDWLNNPAELKAAPSDTLAKLTREFPYFNVIQQLNALRQSAAIHNNTNTRYPIHPVLRYILKAKYNNNYPTAFSYNIDNYVEIPTQEAMELSENIIATSRIGELVIETPPQDYFRLEGLHVSDDLPNEWEQPFTSNAPEENPEQSLMVVMPFSEWLKYLSKLSIKEKAEEESKKSLRALWQKEKLAIALEEETEEIPEVVFEMAVNSIAKQDDIVNESLAEVYVRQEKYQKAIDIYIKLSLLYPEKNTFFASKIEKLKKEL